MDWRRLVGLGPVELVNILQQEAESRMRPHLGSEATEDEALGALPEPLRAVWLVDWVDFEVAQGSLSAYLYNSHGRHAPQVERLFRRIGATSMADVLAEAIAEGERSPRLSELTHRYWEAAESDDWAAKLDEYLAAEVAQMTTPED